ncbi:hypothetical protein ACFRR6_31145 [Streptomyces sp. NPDC056891]|uniref:hypothetical protein n=2 Tax=unclassified Streptomyces TaxID=2593676 RepID=UPI0036C034EF
MTAPTVPASRVAPPPRTGAAAAFPRTGRGVRAGRTTGGVAGTRCTVAAVSWPDPAEPAGPVDPDGPAAPATGNRSPGSSAPSERPADSRSTGRGTARTASSMTPPGASGTAPWPRSLWKEGFQWVASDAEKPYSATVRGPAARTRCTGGNARHASPDAAVGATAAELSSRTPDSAPRAFRVRAVRHFSNIPTVPSNLLSLSCRYACDRSTSDAT